MTGDCAARRSTSWWIFSKTRGTPTNNRGLNLAHGLRQLVELRTVGHLRAVVVHHVIESASRDVRERQKGDAGVGRVEVEIGGREVLVGGDVAVGEGNAFGLAGGAGGVDERGQIVRLDGVSEGVEDRIALGTARIGVAQHLAEGDGAFGSGGIHHHDAFEVGLVAHGGELVELHARGDDGDAAAGVANLLRDLLAGEGGIEGDVGRADGERGKVGNDPLPAVFADERDAIALFRAELEKRSGQGAHALIDLIGRERLPLAEFILPENGARVGRRGHAKEQVVEGCDLRNRHHSKFMNERESS